MDVVLTAPLKITGRENARLGDQSKSTARWKLPWNKNALFHNIEKRSLSFIQKRPEQ
jgi:hypothetical protein